MLEIATTEHQNVPLIKHFLNTACFALAFPEASKFDRKLYVDRLKILSILIKVRNSNNCPRAMTFKQFEKLSERRLLKLLLRFRDHYISIQIIDILPFMRHYLTRVFEDWTETMLNYTKLEDNPLKEALDKKFREL